MTTKLTFCDVFGMFLKYWLSTEDGFVGGERAALASNVWHCSEWRHDTQL